MGDDQSFLGSLSLIGLISFCCIGLGSVAGAGVLAGGAAGTTAYIGAASTRGTLISAFVTALAVVVVAGIARWRYN